MSKSLLSAALSTLINWLQRELDRYFRVESSKMEMFPFYFSDLSKMDKFPFYLSDRHRDDFIDEFKEHFFEGTMINTQEDFVKYKAYGVVDVSTNNERILSTKVSLINLGLINFEQSVKEIPFTVVTEWNLVFDNIKHSRNQTRQNYESITDYYAKLDANRIISVNQSSQCDDCIESDLTDEVTMTSYGTDYGY